MHIIGTQVHQQYSQKIKITDFTKLKIIGDVTCDVDGSVPSTIKSTTIEHPNFYINKGTFEETSETQNALAVMAVDNLTLSELPRDSSQGIWQTGL